VGVIVTFVGDCAGMNGVLACDYHSKLMQSCISTVLQFMYVHELHVGARV